ncbi:sugar phosphate nucleotidyltransferase [Verrucomicrobiales bacterium]|jgi:mannose-1-phosphate guanylyltransferase|nr:sugar phosphate nucleotidyltransferase [Verrucomicrobiales bacterium]
MLGETKKAFILGAGLGTRLRPMTENLPKPLVPVGNKPLITYAFDHLKADLGISEFLINTHHCPEAYGETFPEACYDDAPLILRHESTLLDTAGGIDNIRDWLPGTESFVVYNGDILTDMPLREAWEKHKESGDLVTLILRSTGDELRVGFDPDTGQVVDLRGALQPDWPHRFQFTGIYFVSPAFLKFIRPGKIESVVLPFLEAIRAGEAVGGIVVDEGHWSDLGDRESYLDAQKVLSGEFPRYGDRSLGERISSDAKVSASAEIDAVSAIGSDAEIGEGVTIKESVIWSGASVEKGAVLNRVVVRGGQTATGNLEKCDL